MVFKDDCPWSNDAGFEISVLLNSWPAAFTTARYPIMTGTMEFWPKSRYS